jgi:hypothetical protein
VEDQLMSTARPRVVAFDVIETTFSLERFQADWK